MPRTARSARPRVGVDLRALVHRPTGIGVYTLALLRELAALDRFELIGLVHREPEARAALESIGVAVEVDPAPLGVLWQQLRLPRRLAAGDLDLFWSPLLTLPRRTPIPAVVTIHDLAVLHVPDTLSFKVRWSLLPFLGHTVERADAVIAVSAATARELAHAWPSAAGRIVTIPNGVDPEFQPATAEAIAATRARLGAPGGYVLYAGTVEPRKNLDLLLEAWETLHSERAGELPPLLLAGPYGWKSRRLEERIAAREPLGVRRLGRLERPDLVAAIQAARVFVYPSFYEGFGLPAAEAMACGVPVIAANRSSLPEVVGEAGLLIDPEDAPDLAAALSRLLREPDLAAELGRRGVERAALYSWPRGAAELASLFDRILAEAGAK